MLLERGLHLAVCGAQVRIGQLETPVDHAVKRFCIFGVPSRAREHAGQGQERMVPRSVLRPVARKDCGGGHPVNRRHKNLRINVGGYSVEALLLSPSG